MSKWLATGLVLICAIALSSGFASAATCNLEALKRYPMTDVIERRAVPLETPGIFFRDPKDKSGYSFEYKLGKAGEARARAALERGLKTFAPAERTIMLLAATASWTKADDGLINFFVDEPGIYIDEVLAALDSAGLKDHAAIIRQGRALFGPDYGTQAQRYERWSDGNGTILDPVLDANLKALSARFHALPDLVDAAEAQIRHSPDLAAIYEPLKAASTDNDKLSYLVSGLLTCIPFETQQQTAAQLIKLPAAYGHLILVEIFDDEMLNGSVEQYFYNSSGDFAQELAVSLQELGLGKHADAVRQGIAFFPQPYPSDTGARREIMAERGDAFSRKLEALTDIVDDGGIEPAMIKFAKAANILPQ